MDVKIENGSLIIHVGELFDAMDEHDKAEIVEYLACEDDIIRHVMAQVFDGWTENINHGEVSVGHTTNPTELEKARLAVCEKAEPTLRRELKRMQRIAERAHDNAARYSNWAFHLYHTWPTHHGTHPDGWHKFF